MPPSLSPAEQQSIQLVLSSIKLKQRCSCCCCSSDAGLPKKPPPPTKKTKKTENGATQTTMANPIVGNKTFGLKCNSSEQWRLWETKKLGNLNFPSHSIPSRQQLPILFPQKRTCELTLQNKSKSSSVSKGLWRQFLAGKKRFANELLKITLDFCNN